jgi:hypothetical protein
VNLDEFRRLYYPHVEDLKVRGQTALLCGVSDGRGRVCGRGIDAGNLTPMESDEGMLGRCPKHRYVMCTAAEFLAAIDGHKEAVCFKAVRIAHRSDSA